MRTVEIDAKGRVVIPKDIREQSGISTPSDLLVIIEEEGRITLQSVEVKLRNAQQVGRRKLRSWNAEGHAEERLALKLARLENSK